MSIRTGVWTVKQCDRSVDSQAVRQECGQSSSATGVWTVKQCDRSVDSQAARQECGQSSSATGMWTVKQCGQECGQSSSADRSVDSQAVRTISEQRGGSWNSADILRKGGFNFIDFVRSLLSTDLITNLIAKYGYSFGSQGIINSFMQC